MKIQGWSGLSHKQKPIFIPLVCHWWFQNFTLEAEWVTDRHHARLRMMDDDWRVFSWQKQGERSIKLSLLKHPAVLCIILGILGNYCTITWQCQWKRFLKVSISSCYLEWSTVLQDWFQFVQFQQHGKTIQEENCRYGIWVTCRHQSISNAPPKMHFVRFPHSSKLN